MAKARKINPIGTRTNSYNRTHGLDKELVVRPIIIRLETVLQRLPDEAFLAIERGIMQRTGALKAKCLGRFGKFDDFGKAQEAAEIHAREYFNDLKEFLFNELFKASGNETRSRKFADALALELLRKAQFVMPKEHPLGYLHKHTMPYHEKEVSAPVKRKTVAAARSALRELGLTVPMEHRESFGMVLGNFVSDYYSDILAGNLHFGGGKRTAKEALAGCLEGHPEAEDRKKLAAHFVDVFARNLRKK